jgi:hypothetical protein
MSHSDCHHEEFESSVGVGRLVDDDTKPIAEQVRTGLIIEVRSRCRQCGAPVVFHCPDFGMVADRPTVSVDGQELRLPARLATDPEDFGLQLPGFTIRGVRPNSPN